MESLFVFCLVSLQKKFILQFCRKSLFSNYPCAIIHNLFLLFKDHNPKACQ